MSKKAAAASAVVFDKTGTLTTEKLKVGKTRGYNGFSENDVLKFAAAAERVSTHPDSGSDNGKGGAF